MVPDAPSSRWSPRGLVLASAGIWAAAVLANYAWRHWPAMSVGLDGLSIWSRAEVHPVYVLRQLPAHLKALSAAALFLIAASWAGRGAGAWFAARHAALRATLGLGFGSLTFLGFGLAGLFTFPVMAAVLLAVAAASRVLSPLPCRAVPRAPSSRVPLCRGWVAAVSVALAAAAAGANLLGALAPETGYDSLIQHLADPRAYLAAHRVSWNDLSFLAQHPAGLEMLYAWVLPLGGDGAAKVLHWACGILAAWTMREWMGTRIARNDALTLASVFYLIPFVGILSARAYVDLGLLAYASAALMAPWGGALQGALVGFAVGTKYLGGFLLIGWMAALLVSGRRRGALLFLAAACLAGGAWGVRNWLDTGNPVHPFGHGLMGGPGWDAHSASEYSLELASYGRLPGPEAAPAAPWLVFVRDMGALDDGSLGPLVLAVLPAALVAGTGAAPGVRTLGWLNVFLWLLFAFSPRQVRYALMLMPTTVAWLALRGREWGEKRGATGSAWFPVFARLVPAVLLVQWLVSFSALYRWVNPWFVVTGSVAPKQYLAHILEPRDKVTGMSLYMAEAGRLASLGPVKGKTYIVGDAKAYYLPGRWAVNAIFSPPLLAVLVRSSRDVPELSRRFRQRGIDRVLYSVGGSIHIEYTHHMFHWNDRELAVLERFWGSMLKLIDRLDSVDGDPFFLLYEVRAGNHGWPPYLPGVDTRIAGVEERAMKGDPVGSRREAEALLRDYPSSGYLKARMRTAVRYAHRGKGGAGELENPARPH